MTFRVKDLNFEEGKYITFNVCLEDSIVPVICCWTCYRNDTGEVVGENSGPVNPGCTSIPTKFEPEGGLIEGVKYCVEVGSLDVLTMECNIEDTQCKLYSEEIATPDATASINISPNQQVKGDEVDVTVTVSNEEDEDIYARTTIEQDGNTLMNNEEKRLAFKGNPLGRDVVDFKTSFTMPGSDTTVSVYIDLRWHDGAYVNDKIMKQYTVKFAECHTSSMSIGTGDSFIEVQLLKDVFDITKDYTVELYKCTSKIGCWYKPYGWLGKEPGYELLGTTNIDSEGYACFSNLDSSKDYAVVAKSGEGIAGQRLINEDNQFNRTLVITPSGALIDKLVIIFAVIALFVLLISLRR